MVRGVPSLSSGVSRPLELAGPWDVGVPIGRGSGYGNELVLGLWLVGVFERATREDCATPCRFSSRKSRGQGSPLPPGAKGTPEAAMVRVWPAQCWFSSPKLRGQGPPLPPGEKRAPEAAKPTVRPTWGTSEDLALLPSPPGWLETLGSPAGCPVIGREA